jgi:hypothetical protein
MKRFMLIVTALAAITGTCAHALDFEADRPGSPPAGWTCGVTGGGSPRWTVERDAAAPRPGNVLVQSGRGAYPWCVRADVAIVDGFVEVKFKPVSGREDQAGGLVWRWKDGDHYYVARANALENNVALYYTQGGSRKTLKYVDAPVAPNTWHTLRVEFQATRIKLLLDGKPVLEYDDAHIAGPGAVGVWTKADSVTAFGEFSYGARTGR